LKKIAADRLAMAARSLVYGEDFPHSGPTFRRLEVVDGKAVLTFEHVGAGLRCQNTALSGFFVCGQDRRFRPAEARVSGRNQVSVWCKGIESPAAVRYAWANDPRGEMSLYNSAGLPASPFRTDTYEQVAPLDKPVSKPKAAGSTKRRKRVGNNR
jgi:sialate O-acetylesterase